jgi:hypothetical protein
MRHDVSLTMCFHTLWCRLYQTSEFSASCRPRPRARAVAAWPLARAAPAAGGTGGASLRGLLSCFKLCGRRMVVRYTSYDVLLRLTNRNASMISVVVQNFIFDVHDARRAFATGAPRLTRHLSGTGHAFSM